MPVSAITDSLVKSGGNLQLAMESLLSGYTDRSGAFDYINRSGYSGPSDFSNRSDYSERPDFQQMNPQQRLSLMFPSLPMSVISDSLVKSGGDLRLAMERLLFNYTDKSGYSRPSGYSGASGYNGASG